MSKARWARDEEFDEILAKSNVIFGGEGNTDYFQGYHPKLYVARNSAREHLVVDGEYGIEGILGVFPAQLRILDTVISVDGFGTMGVLKEARGKGHMKELMTTAVSASKARADIAFLGGRRQRYEYFGFTPSGVALSFSFNRDNAKHSIDLSYIESITFEILEENDIEALASIKALYEKRPAHALRDDKLLFATLHTCRSQVYKVLRGGKFFGYLTCGGENRVINEIELLSNKDIALVLASYLECFELRGVSVSAIFMFEREKVCALEAVAENFSMVCCENFQIYNFEKVTNALLKLKSTYARMIDAKTVIDIIGYGKLCIEISGGQGAAYLTDEASDITLNTLEATRLLFGTSAHVLDYPTLSPQMMANLPLPLFYGRPDFV